MLDDFLRYFAVDRTKFKQKKGKKAGRKQNAQGSWLLDIGYSSTPLVQ